MENQTIEDIKRTNLKRILKEKRLNQPQLAKLMGVNPSYISNLITGRQNIGRQPLKRLCEVLHISETDFIAFHDDSAYKSKYYALLERYAESIDENKKLTEEASKLRVELGNAQAELKKYSLVKDHMEASGLSVKTIDDIFQTLNRLLSEYEEDMDPEKKNLMIETAQMLSRLKPVSKETEIKEAGNG